MGPADVDAKRKDLREKAARLLKSDYFTALGVKRTASVDEVKKAYIEAVKAWHPDRVPPGMEDLRPIFAELFARLDQARVTLSDASLRLEYVNKLASGAPSGAGIRAGSPAEAQMELRKAEVFFKKNDLVTAAKLARGALEIDPSSSDIRAFLVTIEAAKPELSLEVMRELVRKLDEIVKKDDKCERALFCRAQLKKRLDLPAEAVKDFALVAELNPRNVDAAREVRLHNMRRGSDPKIAAAKPAASKGPAAGAEEEGGAVGFFKKLFKR